VQEVLSFLGNEPQSDDMCLIGWGRLRHEPEAAMRTAELGVIGSGVTKVLRPDQGRFQQ
jgi:hypothetical protein